MNAMSSIPHGKRGSAFSVVGLQNRRPGVRVPPPLLSGARSGSPSASHDDLAPFAFRSLPLAAGSGRADEAADRCSLVRRDRATDDDLAWLRSVGVALVRLPDRFGSL